MVRDVCRKIQCKIESAVGGSQHRYSQSALQFGDTEKLYNKKKNIIGKENECEVLGWYMIRRVCE